jgi:hypothetical protein
MEKVPGVTGCLPFAGIIRIRFNGYYLRLALPTDAANHPMTSGAFEPESGDDVKRFAQALSFFDDCVNLTIPSALYFIS